MLSDALNKHMNTRLGLAAATLISVFVAPAISTDASSLLEGYLEVTKAMVSDDLTTAKASAED